MFSSSETPKLNRAVLIPHLMKMGEFLKKGFDHYVQMKAADVDMDPDMLAGFLAMQMDSWEPKIKGRPLMDTETKFAGSRFLAGLICNYIKTPEPAEAK